MSESKDWATEAARAVVHYVAAQNGLDIVGWNKDEAADAIRTALAGAGYEVTRLGRDVNGRPICPVCGLGATYQAPLGKRELYCPNAHFWLETPSFKCKAQNSADPPQDCNWPMCGCDPYAEKVIASLQESGYLLDKFEQRRAADAVIDLQKLRVSDKIACDLMTNVCQIIDVVKGEWAESWSEWDQSVRDGITAWLREYYERQEAIAAAPLPRGEGKA